jgi:dTDP-4-dehydrorhamnose 3,5-epimerase
LKVTSTSIPEVLIIEPKVFVDSRGFFYESFNQKAFNQATGLNETFVQDNLSHSIHNVLRGLHYQVQNPQGKLVQVMAGEIFDVAVDLRQSSPSFGRWVATTLSAANRLQHWIPPGFAHGFLVTSVSANVLYKTTAHYAPKHERTIHWNDATIGIQWPQQGHPNLSALDLRAGPLINAELFV